MPSLASATAAAIGSRAAACLMTTMTWLALGMTLAVASAAGQPVRAERMPAIAGPDGFGVAYESPASGQCESEVVLAPRPWLPALVPANPWLATRPATEPRLPAGLRIARTEDEGWRLQYRVVPGDTLGALARRFRVPAADLAAANGIARPWRLVAGRWLSVPSPLDRVSAERLARLPDAIRSNGHRLVLIAHFERWASAYALPPELLQAVAWVESRWQANALSAKGAMGIGQLMPDTVDFVCGVLLRGPCDPWHPEDNIRMSARFLRYLLEETGNLEDALAAYYQGLGALRAHGRYPTADPYVASVLAALALFGPGPPGEPALAPRARASLGAIESGGGDPG